MRRSHQPARRAQCLDEMRADVLLRRCEHSSKGHVRGDSLPKDRVMANHSLRRAYATAATNAGVDEDTVGKLLKLRGTERQGALHQDELSGECSPPRRTKSARTSSRH